MKGVRFICKVLVVASISLGMVALGGCGYLVKKPHKPSRAFSTNIPTTAKYSISYNAKGKFFIADKDGKALPAEHIRLTKLLRTSDTGSDDWLKVLGSYKLYRVKNDKSIWLCDKNFMCYRGQLQDNVNSAVLSLNYDGSPIPFISDAEGKPVKAKNLKPFASLIKLTDLGQKLGIKELSNFTLYRIKGSEKVVDCSWGRCLCTCWHGGNNYTACQAGQCN